MAAGVELVRGKGGNFGKSVILYAKFKVSLHWYAQEFFIFT